MVAMIFEYWFDPHTPEIHAEYERASDAIRRQLAGFDGVLSIERFKSTAEPDKYVTIGVFSDEQAVARWRNHPGHRRIQALGRDRLFEGYRLRMADVTRDYSRDDREQAPADSRAWHASHEGSR